MINEIITNEGGIVLKTSTGFNGMSKGNITVIGSGDVAKVRSSSNDLIWALDYKVTTIDGESFESCGDLVKKLLSFKKGGGSGEGAVESVTGDLVDNEDTSNPIVNLPDWIYPLRADRVGYINLRDNDPIYTVGSEYSDATGVISSWHETISKLTLNFPKLQGVPYKRHMMLFKVNIDEIILRPVEGSNVTINNVLKKAKKGDIWTLTYDSSSNTWDLEAINSVPEWYIKENFVSKEDVISGLFPEGDKIPKYSEQGLLSTGMPLFPENCIPLQHLNIRLPMPPDEGSYVLKSVDGNAFWIEG